jgi:hypothetical protein
LLGEAGHPRSPQLHDECGGGRGLKARYTRADRALSEDRRLVTAIGCRGLKETTVDEACAGPKQFTKWDKVFTSRLGKTM